MNVRCRNCGVWHSTQECTRYGPMYPAPGRTTEDYIEVALAIADRVALDVVHEHLGTESPEGDPLVPDREESSDHGRDSESG